MRALILVLLLGGCAADGSLLIDKTSVTQGYVDDSLVYVIGCPGSLNGCHKKASSICPNGYNIIEESEAGMKGSAGLYSADVKAMMQLKASCR